MKKYAFFGGSFNPPTIAHKTLAIKAAEKLNLDKVFFVPVGDGYKKDGLIDEKHRFKMLQLICNSNEKLDVCDIEINKNYNFKAIDVFKLIDDIYKEDEKYFIMGADNFVNILNWKNATELVSNYKFILLNRNEINLKETNIDILIFAGHKSMYGLFGVGGFITNSRIFDRDKNITPVIFGGNGEDSLNLELSERGISRYEVGSPNIAAIGTLKTAIDTIEKDLSETQERENRLLKYLIEKLEDIDGIHIFQKPETEEEFQNHIAVLSIGFEKYMSDDAGTILDGEYDIAVRTGYHCAPLVHDVIGSKRYGGTVRISMGQFTTKADVDELVAAVRDMR